MKNDEKNRSSFKIPDDIFSPWQHLFIFVIQNSVIIEGFNITSVRGKFERFRPKVELAVLEGHEAGCSEETMPEKQENVNSFFSIKSEILGPILAETHPMAYLGFEPGGSKREGHRGHTRGILTN